MHQIRPVQRDAQSIFRSICGSTSRPSRLMTMPSDTSAKDSPGSTRGRGDEDHGRRGVHLRRLVLANRRPRGEGGDGPSTEVRCCKIQRCRERHRSRRPVRGLRGYVHHASSPDERRQERQDRAVREPAHRRSVRWRSRRVFVSEDCCTCQRRREHRGQPGESLLGRMNASSDTPRPRSMTSTNRGEVPSHHRGNSRPS